MERMWRGRERGKDDGEKQDGCGEEGRRCGEAGSKREGSSTKMRRRRKESGKW